MIATLVVVGIVVVIAFYLIGTYNGFITLRNRVKEAWSDIEVQMKRRYDLIPNLVETVKGYASHEKDTFEKVIQARNMAMQGSKDIDTVAKNENILSGALKSIFALKEAYPDLKANTNFLKLQDELTDTENRMQAARRFYNSNVLSLNTKAEHFPSNIVAGMFGISKEKFFELQEEAARDAVKVKF
ncbi:LemA protein [Elusimicrobium posterum]|uniref:LemA family protein n=1 Tax=Elusimicrobium posterum TaxID=3116653 RepID=UPI003C77D44D